MKEYSLKSERFFEKLEIKNRTATASVVKVVNSSAGDMIRVKERE